MLPLLPMLTYQSLETRGRGKKITLTVSFLEIYLEKIRDLGRLYVAWRKHAYAS
jgi:hypothetical protein